jgi:hypothetical protein
MSKPPPPQSNLIQPLSEDQAARLRPRPHGQCKILPDFGQPSEVATWRDELRGSAEVSLLIVSTLAILRELLFPRHGKRLPGCRHVHEHFAVFGRFGPETLLVMLAGHRSKVWVRHLRRKGCDVILVWQHNDLRAHVKSSYSFAVPDDLGLVPQRNAVITTPWVVNFPAGNTEGGCDHTDHPERATNGYYA